jgi:pentatricopeptide repeat protein
MGDSVALSLDENEFALFFNELQSELSQSGGSDDSVSEEEARELFLLMREEYNEVMKMSPESLASALGVDDLNDLDTSDFDDTDDDNRESDGDRSSEDEDKDETPRSAKPDSFQQLIDDIKDDWRAQGAVLDDDDFGLRSRSIESQGVSSSSRTFQHASASLPSRPSITRTVTLDDMDISGIGISGETNLEVPSALPSDEATTLDNMFTSTDIGDFGRDEEAMIYESSDAELDALRQQFPVFSDRRLRKVLKVFRGSLGDPSLLDLVPLVRERMPDFITNTWLKQANALTARYVVLKASEEGLVDVHMLNGVLELEALSGGLDRAMEFYDTEFERQNIAHNEYSHRLILQMLVENGRFTRALAFKESMVESGQPPDILSYGSLVEYCGRRQQLGSAMFLLKECISVHGAPPGEASLTALRRLCRNNGQLTRELETLIGPDPSEWLRHGEAHLKREMSKKGRRDVQIARNRLVHL